MDSMVPRLISLGAVLDGPIRYEAYGKVAAVRSPDGHMVGLYESADLPGDGDTKVAAAAAAQAHMAAGSEGAPPSDQDGDPKHSR